MYSYVTSYHHIICETTGNYLHQLFGLWWTGRIHSTHMYHFSNSTRLKNAVHRVMQKPGTAEGFKHLELGKDHFPRSWNSNPLVTSLTSLEVHRDLPRWSQIVSAQAISPKVWILVRRFAQLFSPSPWCFHGPSRSPWFASPTAFLECEAIQLSFQSARIGRKKCQTNGKPKQVSSPKTVRFIWMKTQTLAVPMACNVARENAYWKDVKPWNVKSVTGNWAKCPRISKRRFAKIQLFAMTQSKVIFVAVPSTLVDVEVQNIHVTVVISSSRPMKPALWTKWVKHEVTVKIQMFAISLEMLIHVLMVGASGIVRTCVVRMEAVKWRDDPSLSAGKKVGCRQASQKSWPRTR